MTEWAGRRVLVTGGGGFIGRHLCTALAERGAKVTAADRSPEPIHPDVSVVPIDLLSADLAPLLRDGAFASVFHLAGNVEVPFSVAHPGEDLALNAELTLRVLEALERTLPEARLLLTSTAAVYGEAAEGPCDEETPAAPVAPYGASKWLAEQYVALHARRHGRPATSVRLFSVYGPGLHKLVVHDLIAKVERDPDRLEVRGDGAQVRDFTYVSDAVEALLLVSQRAPAAGEVINVASGVPVTIAELARAVCDAAGVDAKIDFVGAEAAGVSQRWIADPSRLRALGYAPKVSLAEGLAHTVAWYRREGRPA